MVKTISTKFSGLFDNSPQRLLYLIVFSFSFLLYANTLFNSYNLDDDLVTINHKVTSEGISIDNIKKIFNSPYYEDEMGYSYEFRPIVHLSFAIEHAIFGERAWLSHLINILLYALSIVVLLKVLQQLFGKYAWWLPVITVMLFAAHPIHTEVVASIKNRDEILAFLFSMLALDFAWRFVNKKNWTYLLAFAVTFVIGMYSKRSAIAFVFIIPFALILFTNINLKQLVGIVLPFPFVVYHLNPIYIDSIRWAFIAGIPLIPFGFYIITKTEVLKITFKKIAGFCTAFLPKSTFSLTLAGTFIWFVVIVAVIALGAVANAHFLVAIGMGLLIYIYFFIKSPIHKWLPVLISILVAALSLNNEFTNPLYILAISLLVLIVFYGGYSKPRIIISLLAVLTAYFFIDSAFIIKLDINLIGPLVLFYLIKRFNWKILVFIPIVFLIQQFLHFIHVDTGTHQYYEFPLAIFGFAFVLSIRTKIGREKKKFANWALLLSVVTLVSNMYLYPTELFENKINNVVSDTYGKSNLKQLMPLHFFFPNSPEIYNAPGDAPTPLTPSEIKSGLSQSVLISMQFRKIRYLENPIPYLDKPTEKAGTIVNTLGHYIKLLVIPHPLSFYYGYNQVEVLPLSNPKMIFYLSVYLALILIMFVSYFKWRILSFAIFIYLVSILPFANIINPVAGIVGERLAFIASIGFCLAIGWLVINLFKFKDAPAKLKAIPKVALGIIVVLLVAYSVKTVIRNSYWKDQLTLYTHDITHLEQSSQANNLMAGQIALTGVGLSEQEHKARLLKAVSFYKKSTEIYPGYLNPQYDLGEIYYALGNYEASAERFKKVFEIDTSFYDAGMKAGLAYEKAGNDDAALEVFNEIAIRNPKYIDAILKVSLIYFIDEQYQTAIDVCIYGIRYNPQAYPLYLLLAEIYLETKQPEKAQEQLEQVAVLSPGHPKLKQLGRELNKQLKQ